MWQDFFSSLSSWGCVLLAFGPASVIAIVVARFSSRIDRSNDNLMTSILRVSGGALVFLTSFAIATVWQQASSYLNEVHSEYAAARALAREAGLELPGDQAEIVSSALDGYMSAAMTKEFSQPFSPTEDPPAQGEFEVAVEAIAKAAATAGTATGTSAGQTNATAAVTGTSVSSRLDALIAARDTRVDRNSQPGVPLVVALTVMFLAWIVVALLSLYPGTQPRVKAMHVTMAVLVVGLVQLPLLYLGSNNSTRELLGQMISS